MIKAPGGGGGGPSSIFTLCLILIEENVSYQELFSDWKNIVPSLSYRGFKSQKYIQLHYQWALTLIAIPRTSSLKYIFSYNFWGRPLKLCGYVLRVYTELLSSQIFSEKMQFSIFKMPYFHFWGLNQKSWSSKVSFQSIEHSCKVLRVCDDWRRYIFKVIFGESPLIKFVRIV